MTLLTHLAIILHIFVASGQQYEELNDDKETYKLNFVNDALAKCLDGTQPSFYFNQGFDEGANKFIVYFQGGGQFEDLLIINNFQSWIGGNDLQATIEDAFQRSEGMIGSSKTLSLTKSWGSSIFSRNPTKNPHFYNWNSVYINYCDGTGHQGFKTDPILQNGRNLYFRGEANTKGVIKELQDKYNFLNAEYVYLSGCSAGGLATYNWASYFRSLFQKTTQVVAQQYNIYKILSAPDSGLFLDMQRIDGDEIHRYSNYYFKSFMQISNTEVDPINTKCVQANPNEKWKCLMSPYLVDYIDIPLLFIQSHYDIWSIPNILGVNCVGQGNLNRCTVDQLRYIEEHHMQGEEIIKRALRKDQTWGSWVISCANHWQFFNLRNKKF